MCLNHLTWLRKLHVPLSLIAASVTLITQNALVYLCISFVMSRAPVHLNLLTHEKAWGGHVWPLIA